jgi:CubicO group peptidase (beta-lactamase class C family)
LGYALENATGLPYVDIIKRRITQPLGLNNTGFALPKPSAAIIPAGTQWFEVDMGNYRQ